MENVKCEYETRAEILLGRINKNSKDRTCEANSTAWNEFDKRKEEIVAQNDKRPLKIRGTIF